MKPSALEDNKHIYHFQTFGNIHIWFEGYAQHEIYPNNKYLNIQLKTVASRHI